MAEHNIIRFNTIDSTNSFLKYHHEAYPDLTVVTAKIQTGGKGRFNRKWISDEGGLWFSVLVQHTKPEKAFLLTFAAAISMSETLKSQGIQSGIKWPNDIIIGRKKVCGILTENLISGSECKSIVGVGLNVNNQPPLENSTSVSKELGNDVELVLLLNRFMDSFISYCAMFRKGNHDDILSTWNSCWSGKGKHIVINTANGPVEGIADRISDDGALIVEKDGNELHIFEGDMSS